VRNVVLATFPNFVEEKRAWLLGGAVKIVLQTAFFLARGTDERAQFRFEQQVLALFGAEHHNQSESTLGKLGDFCALRPATGPPLDRFLRFSFRHVGGDCTPTGHKRNGVL
jgi:hypothetical protein